MDLLGTVTISSAAKHKAIGRIRLGISVLRQPPRLATPWSRTGPEHLAWAAPTCFLLHRTVPLLAKLPVRAFVAGTDGGVVSDLIWQPMGCRHENLQRSLPVARLLTCVDGLQCLSFCGHPPQAKTPKSTSLDISRLALKTKWLR